MAGRSTAPRVDPGVWDHPKTKAVARQLGMQPGDVVYHLTQMWGGVLRKKSNGLVLPGLPTQDSLLAALKTFRREIGVKNGSKFLQALKDAGFVEERTTGWWVHDWDDWQGSASRTRVRAESNYYVSNSYLDSGSGVEGLLELGPVITGDRLTDTSGSRVQVVPEGGIGVGGTGEGGQKNVISETATNDKLHDSQSTNYFTRFMYWITKGFVDGAYGFDKMDPSHLVKNGQGVDMALVAECYIAIDRGLFGDDYDQRNLTARHAMKKIGPFSMFKRRKRINGTIITLTAEGSIHHPSAGRSGAKVAGNDARTAPGGNGAADPSADSDELGDLENYPKYREWRDRQAAEQEGLAF